MKKIIKITSIIFLVLFLVFIRGFASKLFYDPLQGYFYNDYLYTSLPQIDTIKLLMFMLLRYTVNAIISLFIIHLMFGKKRYIIFSIYFYSIALIVLITAFYWFLHDKFESGYVLPFCIRRFIIHPVFLLVLLPAFYYQKLHSK